VYRVYYESIKREPKIRGIKKCRCDERLQTKTKEFTRLPYTGLVFPTPDLGSKKRKGLKKMKMNGGPLQTKERALFFKTTSDLALQQISSSRCSSPSWYGVRRGACVSVLLPFRLHVAIVYLNAQHVVLRFLHASARGYISIIGGWEVKED
jgi:hypothetical protein